MHRIIVSVAAVLTLAFSFHSSVRAESVTAPPASTVAVPATDKVPAPAPAEKRFRIGYADLTQIAEQSDAGKVAKTHFEAKADRHKSQIDTKQKLLEKQKATLEQKLPTYTPEQRVAKIKDYEKKVEELKKLLQKADKEMRPMQEELIREVFEKIEKVAREYGAANGYSAIIDRRELLFLGEGVEAEDVTKALIAELNKK